FLVRHHHRFRAWDPTRGARAGVRTLLPIGAGRALGDRGKWPGAGDLPRAGRPTPRGDRAELDRGAGHLSLAPFPHRASRDGTSGRRRRRVGLHPFAGADVSSLHGATRSRSAPEDPAQLVPIVDSAAPTAASAVVVTERPIVALSISTGTQQSDRGDRVTGL